MELKVSKEITCKWIDLKESRIPLTVGFRNQISTDKESGIQFLESSSWNPESTAWNPEFKLVLDQGLEGVSRDPWIDR